MAGQYIELFSVVFVLVVDYPLKLMIRLVAVMIKGSGTLDLMSL